MKKVPSVIKSGLAVIRQAGYDLSDEQLFPIWAIAMDHFDGNLDTSALEDAYACTQALIDESTSPNTRLNGFFYAPEDKELFLYHFREIQDISIVASASDAREVGNALQLLYSDMCSNDDLPESRKAACQALQETLAANGVVNLRGVSFGKWRPAHQDIVTEMVPKPIAKHVNVKLLSADYFTELIDSRVSDLAGQKIRFDLYRGIEGRPMNLPDQGVKGVGEAYTAVISAFSLADVAAQWGDRLYDRNVRRHLGYGTKVNRNITHSLSTSEGRKSFWYGHNGITILCDRLDAHDVGSGNDRSFLLTNPQIVNGCQTTVAIKNGVGPADRRKPPQIDFGISARIIILKGNTEEKAEVSNDIALKTNTQLTVTDADLRSNDRVQQLFEKKLNAYGERWFYIRKRGDWVRLQHKPVALAKYSANNNDYRRIDPQLYQQAWRSYTGTPSSAITAKGEVWTTNALYDQVFSESRRECDIVLCTILFDWFCQVFAVDRQNRCLAATIHPGLGEHVQKMKKSKVRCAAHCLALFGKLVEAAYQNHSAYPEPYIDQIVSKLKRGGSVKSHWTTTRPGTSWAVLGDAVELTFRVFSQFCYVEVDRVNELQKSDTTLFALLKQPESLEKMWKDLRSERRLEFKELVTPK